MEHLPMKPYFMVRLYEFPFDLLVRFFTVSYFQKISRKSGSGKFVKGTQVQTSRVLEFTSRDLLGWRGPRGRGNMGKDKVSWNGGVRVSLPARLNPFGGLFPAHTNGRTKSPLPNSGV